MSLVLIDGAKGEGGGQVLRSSLALSLITGRPVRIDNIRAKRAKSGLMRQHLTAVQAAAEIGAAQLNGASLGSSRLTFTPTQLKAGEYHFAIGTAGSTMLVLQTILLPLLLADGPSRVILEGGTHNPMAPPYDFIERVYLPLLNRMGGQVTASLVRAGFYPAGGGRCVIDITPTQQLGRLDLLERGPLLKRSVRAVVAQLPRHIAERELHQVLSALDWPEECGCIEALSGTASPGNVLMAELTFEGITEVFTAFGERGKPAEQVADDLLSQVQTYLTTDAPIGEHLADQLLLPLGLATHQGATPSTFLTSPLSDHVTTHIDVLHQFLDLKISTKRTTDGTILLHLSSP